MKSHLTLKDIAKYFDLSVSTVSRALRNDKTISEDTRARIINYARENRYNPNFIAANLRKQESNVIGVIIPEISNAFFSRIIDGIEDVADKNNYTLIITQSDEKWHKEKKCVQTLLSSRVAGILVSISKTTESYEHFNDIVNSNVGLVFFDRRAKDFEADSITVTDEFGAFSAVEYLIMTGCKRIAFYGSSSNLEIAENRKRGYLKALRQYGIKEDKSLIYECDTNLLAKEITYDVLSLKDRPDAIFTINDNTAAGVIYIAKRMGISIPGELSVCGFGDGYISENTDPSITSIDQNPFLIGKYSAERLLNKIKCNNDTDKSVQDIEIETSLIIRSSTGFIKD